MVEIVVIIGGRAGRKELISALRRSKHRVSYTEDSGEALNLLAYQTPCAVIIDEDQYSAQGEELLVALREATSAPIIVEGTGEEPDIVRALISGADAYLHWPASPPTVLAYLRALLRRDPPPQPAGLHEHRKPSTTDGTRDLGEKSV